MATRKQRGDGMSNFQIAIIVFFVFVAGAIVVLAIIDGGIRRSEAEIDADDAEQLDAVSRPAPLPRRRAGVWMGD